MKKVKLAIFGVFLVAVTGCKKAENNAQALQKDLFVSTLAGTGALGFQDGPGMTAQFNSVRGITMDPNGNLYVSDFRNNRIRKITPDGIVSTFAGSTAGYADGTGTAAKFNNPIGIIADRSGNLYVVDNGNSRIRKITAAGVVSTYAGSGEEGLLNGNALTAQFLNPRYLTIDASNNLYVTDNGNNCIRKISSSGQVTTFAGSGQFGADDGPAATATIAEPTGITIDPSGNIYVSHLADYGFIRKITPGGQVIRIAGDFTPGSYLDGVAGVARFRDIANMKSDADGNIYIADSGNSVIRKYDPKTNMVTTFAGFYNYVTDGNGRQRSTGTFKDGPANQAIFNVPFDFEIGLKGEFYVADQTNNMVRKIVSVDAPLSQSDLDKKNWNKPTNWK
ncbi:hypothetical protein DBR43_20385 [Pedobacter sp. KBW06]|uniref:NHL repeat-containing protein n=1 Tax=Pedobacter sp. KBW06 TaxID=2153359 RepID=UPI000F5B3332|nr:NHL repeat-containing protein [Pedobacter sp. KBW06]RQO70380.1 hypothetical protein DBR43_20385 [Pedobacter sp. KBW06]